MGSVSVFKLPLPFSQLEHETGALYQEHKKQNLLKGVLGGMRSRLSHGLMKSFCVFVV